MILRPLRLSLQCWPGGARLTRRGLTDSKDPSGLLDYSIRLSSPLPPPLSALQAESAQHFPNSGMMTAATVLRLNMLLCRSLRANKLLDIRVFTGIALIWGGGLKRPCIRWKMVEWKAVWLRKLDRREKVG